MGWEDLSKINCLTIKYSGIANAIQCSVNILYPKSLLSVGEIQKSNNCIAIWDTGATGSAITELTAQKMGLIPTGIKKVSGLGGTIEKNTYLIDLVLPNNVTIQNLSVTEVDNPRNEKGEKIEPFGMLIGMDIISAGDFTISNYRGQTLMSFRIPSIVDTDYVAEWKRRKSVQDKTKRR